MICETVTLPCTYHLNWNLCSTVSPATLPGVSSHDCRMTCLERHGPGPSLLLPLSLLLFVFCWNVKLLLEQTFHIQSERERW